MKSYSTVLVTATLASFTVAEYRPREHLLLLDCGFAPNGYSNSRYFAYYPDIPWDSNNVLREPAMLQNVPWDGSYPWRADGVKVITSNGDEWNVAVSPERNDIDEPPEWYAGFAWHKFEEHVPLCYGWHERDVFHLDDGTECGSAYICHHFGEPDSPLRTNKRRPDDDASGGDDDNDVVFEHGTTVTVESDTISVAASDYGPRPEFDLVTPEAAFATIDDALEGNMCKSKTYPISDKCTISYDCTFSGREGGLEERRNAMAKFLKGTAAPKVAESEHTWTTYSQQWGVPTHHKAYDYPRSGKIVVQAWPQGNEDGIFLQGEMAFKIECDTANWFCKVGCNTLATGMLALGYQAELAPVGVFGTLGAGLCNELCK